MDRYSRYIISRGQWLIYYNTATYGNSLVRNLERASSVCSPERYIWYADGSKLFCKTQDFNEFRQFLNDGSYWELNAFLHLKRYKLIIGFLMRDTINYHVSLNTWEVLSMVAKDMTYINKNIIFPGKGFKATDRWIIMYVGVITSNFISIFTYYTCTR